jgi:hypothetical protein
MITMFWFTALGRRMVLRACDGLLAPFARPLHPNLTGFGAIASAHRCS